MLDMNSILAAVRRDGGEIEGVPEEGRRRKRRRREVGGGLGMCCCLLELSRVLDGPRQ